MPAGDTGPAVALVILLAQAAAAHAGEEGPRANLAAIQLTCVDERATGYGTFQSHNQKVLSNSRGLFMTHIRTRNEAYTAQTWRLSWSRDGGRTWETLFEATHATNPPVLETDAAANLYLIRPDFQDGDAYLYRFRAAEGYARPAVSRIKNGAAGKYAMLLDPVRKQLDYFAHNNTYHVIGLDGEMRASTVLLRAGKSAALQYPLLSLDEDGALHAAWTTQAHGRYLYWDIHHLQSPGGGAGWRRMDGTEVTLPAVADEGGPADRITLDDEFEAHTWLSSFLVKEGKAHFLYLAQTQPPRQHYVRYELKTGKRDLDVFPRFQGSRISIRGLDGFFATRSSEPGSTLYCVGREETEARLACLASDDNGRTWRDHALSEKVENPYAIGGARELAEDGSIIGSFTDQVASTTESGGGPKVYFFKIPGGRRPAELKGRQRT